MSISKLDRNLPRIAAGIMFFGFAGLAGVWIHQKNKFRREAIDAFKQSEFFYDSLKILRGYPNLKVVLGEPVQEKGFNLYDPFNQKSEHYARMTVAVEGSVAKGSLLSWSSYDNKTENWRVDRLDIKKDNQQFTFFLHPERHDGGHPDVLRDSKGK